jgi:hypothetical protein
MNTAGALPLRPCASGRGGHGKDGGLPYPQHLPQARPPLQHRRSPACASCPDLPARHPGDPRPRRALPARLVVEANPVHAVLRHDRDPNPTHAAEHIPTENGRARSTPDLGSKRRRHIATQPAAGSPRRRDETGALNERIGASVRVCRDARIRKPQQKCPPPCKSLLLRTSSGRASRLDRRSRQSCNCGRAGATLRRRAGRRRPVAGRPGRPATRHHTG